MSYLATTQQRLSNLATSVKTLMRNVKSRPSDADHRFWNDSPPSIGVETDYGSFSVIFFSPTLVCVKAAAVVIFGVEYEVDALVNVAHAGWEINRQNCQPLKRLTGSKHYYDVSSAAHGRFASVILPRIAAAIADPSRAEEVRASRDFALGRDIAFRRYHVENDLRDANRYLDDLQEIVNVVSARARDIDSDEAAIDTGTGIVDRAVA
jgi:hypothetical protein